MPSTHAEAIVEQLFFTPEGRRDPYPLYHRLREAAPVHRSDRLEGWLLTNYDDCWAVLRDPRFGKDYPTQTARRIGPDWRRHPSLTSGEHSMLNLHGPDHMRLRRLVSKAFTRRTIEGLRAGITRCVTNLVDELEQAGGGDLLELVAFPLPVTIIGELLGVPEDDRARFRKLVLDFTGVLEARPTPAQLETADAAQQTMREYFLALLDEKRRHPTDDLLARLTQIDMDGDRLSDDELSAMGILLFAAGFETTTNLIGNGMLGLLAHSNQLAVLRANQGLFEALPDELLRYDGTVQMAVRVTMEPVIVGEVEIPAGETVFALLGAGNHDPAQFPDPDRLDVTRTDVQALSFGGGVHFCLGASLARVETEVTFRELLGRFDVIELAGEAPAFRDRLVLRGVNALRLRCRRTRATVAAPARPAAHPGLALRPPRVDATWRNAHRSRMEQQAAGSRRGRTARGIATTAALLARTPLFRTCPPDELAKIAETAYPLSFEPGDVLCEEGAESDEAYAIAEGEATVTIGGRPVCTVTEDDVVGERGPLEGRSRTATVTASTHMITYAISRQRLLELVQGNPVVGEAMRDMMHERYTD